jgi:hypothetical protein
MFPHKLFNDDDENKRQLAYIKKVNAISKGYFARKLSARDFHFSINTERINGSDIIQSFASTNWNDEVFAILSLGKRVFLGGLISGLPSGGDWSNEASNLAVWHPDYIGVEKLDYKEAFYTIAPNATQNYSIIKSPFTIQEVKIWDITGKLIFETKPALQQKEYSIEQSVFPKSGIYFTNIQTENGTTQSQKLLVQ